MFDWLKKLFASYEPEEETKKQQETVQTPAENDTPTEKPLEDNSFDLQEHIIDGVVKALRPLRGMKNLSGISVFSEDPYCLAVMRNDEFARELALAFDNADMASFGLRKVAVIDTLPHDRSHLITAVDGKVYVSIAKQAEKIYHTTARLTPLKEGTLEKTEYLLDSQTKTTYHIGRGRQSSRNTLRFNDIVINDDHATVSSEQADIIHRNGSFHLKACKGGCRAEGGSATKILTGDSAKELMDTISMVRLHHGNIIELGKDVLIKFENQ